MIEVFCDGGARGNPGPAAYGFVVQQGDIKIHEESGFLGIGTNNFAEYTALIKAFEYLSQKFMHQEVNFFLDSELVVNQMSGLFKIKSVSIRSLVVKVRELESNFKTVRYNHIPRIMNKEADKLVNIALDSQVKHGA